MNVGWGCCPCGSIKELLCLAIQLNPSPSVLRDNFSIRRKVELGLTQCVLIIEDAEEGA